MFDICKYCVAGSDFKVNDNITIHNPTLQEIVVFGEEKYDRICYLITMRPYDDMVGLWDKGIDYTSVKDYDLFISNIIHAEVKMTSILFGDLDFTKFVPMVSKPAEETANNKDENVKPTRVILYQRTEDGREIVIDEAIYNDIVGFVRAINDIEAKVEYDVGNQAAKEFLIERTRTKLKRASKKQRQSRLSGLISALVGMGVGYTYTSIMDLKISQMHDLFKRVIKIEDYHNLMGAAHAGAKLSGNEKTRLIWYGNYENS